LIRNRDKERTYILTKLKTKTKTKSWKRKSGKTIYPLPKCKNCGKRSNTTDKETAQIAKRFGRICRRCTKELPQRIKEGKKFRQEYNARFINPPSPLRKFLDIILNIRRCRVCGCTDKKACPGGCHWVQNNLCSRCKND